MLQADNTIDLAAIKLLAEAASPVNITIHKAVDLCPDPIEAVIKLKKVQGISYVLTSGGAPTAEQGIPVLREMIREATKRLT